MNTHIVVARPRAPHAGDYYTDGKKLVRVLAILGTRIEVENCSHGVEINGEVVYDAFEVHSDVLIRQWNRVARRAA